MNIIETYYNREKKYFIFHFEDGSMKRVDVIGVGNEIELLKDAKRAAAIDKKTIIVRDRKTFKLVG